MQHEVILPAIGESISAVTVSRWLKHVGDVVTKGEPLMEVSTDKADTEISSPVSGVLKEIRFNEDEFALVGSVIAMVEMVDDGADSSRLNTGMGWSGPAESPPQVQSADIPDWSRGTAPSPPPTPSPATPAWSSGTLNSLPAPSLDRSGFSGDTIPNLQPTPSWLGEPIAPLPPVEPPASPVEPSASPVDPPASLAEPPMTPPSYQTLPRSNWQPPVVPSWQSGALPSWQSPAVPSWQPPAVRGWQPPVVPPEPASQSVFSASQEPEPMAEPEPVEPATVEPLPPKPVFSPPALPEPAPQELIPPTPQPSVVWPPVPSYADSPNQDVDLKSDSSQPASLEALSDYQIATPAASDDQAISPSPAVASWLTPDTAPDSASESIELAFDVVTPSRPIAPELEPVAPFMPDHEPTDQADDDKANIAYLTPLVRKLADEHGVDLNTVKGSGVGGRIRKQDILAAAAEIAARQAAAQAEFAESEASGEEATSVDAVSTPPSDHTGETPPLDQTSETPPPDQTGETPPPDQPPPIASPFSVVPPAPTTAEPTAPHHCTRATATVEVDVTVIARLQVRVREEFEAREGVPLTYSAFVIKAAAEALKRYPKLNAAFKADGIVGDSETDNVGITINTPEGAVIPVIQHTGDLSVTAVAKKLADLENRAQSGQLTPAELTGAYFTISNYGESGTLFDTPIINQNETAQLGIGTASRRPIVVCDPQLGEIIAVRDCIYLSLSYNQSLIDFKQAANFLGSIKAGLEGGDFGAQL